MLEAGSDSSVTSDGTVDMVFVWDDILSILLGPGVRWYTVVYILDVYIEAYPSLVRKSSR